jgi:hypothetical protein
MAGFAAIAITSPILSDGLRPVGRAWPANQETAIKPAGKRFLDFQDRDARGAEELTAGPAFAARALRRQAIMVPRKMQILMPVVSRLLTTLKPREWLKSGLEAPTI